MSHGKPLSIALTYTFHVACQWPDRDWSFLAADLEDQVFPVEMELLQEMIAELRASSILPQQSGPPPAFGGADLGVDLPKKKITVEASPTRPAPLPRNVVHPDSQCSSNYGMGLELQCTCLLTKGRPC